MTYRIPRSDICMSDAMPFQQHWEARIPVPIKDIEDDPGLALHAAFSSFMPGDEVAVCSFERKAGEWVRLREFAVYRIAAKAGTTIEAVRIGSITQIAAPTPEQEAAAFMKLSIVKTSDQSFEVRDTLGNTIEAFVDAEQAQTFADREMARQGKGIKGLKIKPAFGKFNVVDSGGAVVKQGFARKADAEAWMRGELEAA